MTPKRKTCGLCGAEIGGAVHALGTVPVCDMCLLMHETITGAAPLQASSRRGERFEPPDRELRYRWPCIPGPDTGGFLPAKYRRGGGN